MTVTSRRYKLLVDFNKVSQFLDDNYNTDTFNGYLLKQFFEYAHTHPFFKHQDTPRFRLWEDGENIVGLACYEMRIGENFLCVKKTYENLIPEMLEYSEKELSKTINGKQSLNIWITDRETEKSKLLLQNGYKKVSSHPVTTFSYDKPFPETKLPDGFSIISLEEENDFKQINACLWKGFNHGPDPDDDIGCRILMQSGPNFRKDLTTVVKAPNGDYACFAGMWLDEQNEYAYLEPLATVPEYRRMGLATAALTEGMKKTKKLGAKYCFGGVNEFYYALGFETACYREKWEKEWNAD